MATKKEIDEHLNIALDEIGEIKPWFEKEVDCWIFSHKNYPVEYGGDSAKEVIKNYPKYLREFIAHRLEGKVSEINEKETKGRGGYREGAGRPKGAKSAEPTIQIRVPPDIAAWLKTPGTISHVRGILRAYTPIRNNAGKKQKKV
jgi:hypothetical protein